MAEYSKELTQNGIDALEKGYYDEAFEYIFKAAERGYPKAMNRLGLLYASGQGIQQNDKEAFYWFKRAAKLGDVDAMTNLANAYYRGDGVLKNRECDLYWMRRAARLGSIEAEVALDEILVGVEDDWEESTLIEKGKRVQTTNSYCQSSYTNQSVYQPLSTDYKVKEDKEYLEKETKKQTVANAVLDVMNFVGGIKYGECYK